MTTSKENPIENTILTVFEKTIPKLNDSQKERLLSFGEGMSYMADLYSKADKEA